MHRGIQPLPIRKGQVLMAWSERQQKEILIEGAKAIQEDTSRPAHERVAAGREAEKYQQELDGLSSEE